MIRNVNLRECGDFLNERLSGIPYEKSYPLKEHTTMGIGEALPAFFPEEKADAIRLLRLANEYEIPVFVLGGGSNLLAEAKEFKGVLLCTKNLSKIRVEDKKIVCESGVTVGKLLSVAKENGLSGVEFLSGIPAQVGGLTYMNAGVTTWHMQNVVESVTAILNGEEIVYDLKGCEFDYKKSVFQRNGAVILSVTLSLQRASKEEIQKKTAYFINRRLHLPKGKSMGCVFKNPYPSLSAGQLLELCGCKGWREGGASVSTAHANFIMNDGNATFYDVVSLIERVRRAVYDNTGLLLQEEIRYLK